VLVTFLWATALVLVELAGPVIAELRKGGTPWHPHHVAERYGLLVIIALGEAVLGTTVALSAIVESIGWSADVVLLGLAGTALTFGMWWIYFVLPAGELLARHRERSFGWGYGHIVLFGALVAVGAGLHAAAYHVEHHSVLGVAGTVLTVAIPVALYVVSIFALSFGLTRTADPFHLVLIAGSALVVGASVVLAFSGAPLIWCLLVLALTPWVSVVGYETVGHRHGDHVLEEVAGS
jgi:low temperature requirement protein LtrA